MKKRFSDQHILENQPFRVVFVFLQREFRVMSLTGKKGARLGPLMRYCFTLAFSSLMTFSAAAVQSP